MVLLEELIREATWSRGSPCLLVPAAHLVCCVLQQFCLSFWPLDTRDVESQRGNTIPTCIQHQFGVFYRLRQSLRMIAKFHYYPFLVWTVFERCLVAFAETMISFKQLPLALVVLAARPYQSSSARCFDVNNSLSNTMPAATVNILDNASELGDISLGSGVPRTWEGICLRVSAPLLSCFWNGTHSSDKDVVAMGRYVSMRAVDVATMATMRTSCFQVIKNEGPISEAAEGHAFLIFVGPLVKIAVARVICHLFSEYMLLHQIIQKGFLTAPPKWERRRRRRAEFSEFGRRAYDEFGADIHKKLEAVRDEPSEKVNSGDTTPINTELEKNSKMQDIVDKALDKFNSDNGSS